MTIFYFFENIALFFGPTIQFFDTRVGRFRSYLAVFFQTHDFLSSPWGCSRDPRAWSWNGSLELEAWSWRVAAGCWERGAGSEQKPAKASKSKQKQAKAIESKRKQAKASKSKRKQAKASKSKQNQAWLGSLAGWLAGWPFSEKK